MQQDRFQAAESIFQAAAELPAEDRDALLAATAIAGPTAELAMQIALVHLMFNLLGISIIYVLPFLRGVPPAIANFLADLAQRNKLYVGAYIGGVFFGLPLLLIGGSQL